MNKKHLIYWMWRYLESIESSKELIQIAEEFNYSFSDKPQSGEISVAKALKESLKEYKAVKQ